MEIKNPISDLHWLLGSWQGKLENESGEKLESLINFQLFGKDIISYEKKVKIHSSNDILEKGFFFFDKINEILKHIIINEEGYIELGSIEIKSKKNCDAITSKFEQGYNLPPNSIIIRKMSYDTSIKELELETRIGKSEKIFSYSSYQKK